MRLIDEMSAERDRLNNLSAGYGMAGDRELARKALYAAQAINAGITGLSIYNAALMAVKPQEDTDEQG